MKALLLFVLLANLFAGLLTTLCYFLIPIVHQQKIVDLLFIVGLIFWACSSLVRLGGRRYRANESTQDMVLNDQQHVLQLDHLATRLLIAGAVPLACAILVGSLFY